MNGSSHANPLMFSKSKTSLKGIEEPQRNYSKTANSRLV
jgi:hypothetical protein